MQIRAMAALFGLVLPIPAAAEVAVPPIWPQVQGIFPRGGQRGADVRVTVRGRNLQDAREVRFLSPHLSGAVIKSGPYEAVLSIRVGPQAEPGRHDLRLQHAHGSTLAYFDVSAFAERLEKEPNENPKQAEELTFPALVNGILRAGDYDYFRFEARAGQVLTFDVQATRLGAQTDAALGLLDEAGNEIAYSDDYYGFKDPHLVHTFSKAGTYYLRVHGSSEAGCDTCDYRLVAGEMPHADYAMPAGGKAGTTAEFALRGVNLQGVKSVTLGNGLARGEVVSASPGEARVRMPVPAGVPPGDYRLHAEGAALPVPFVVSGYAEVDVSGGRARSRLDPVPVSLPVVANGVLDRPRAADHFIFRADEPKTVVLETNSMQLGFLTDPLVAIYDESGKRLAYQDDPTTNTGKEPANLDAHLVFRLPKAGRYIAMVRDAQFRGDPAFAYRLTIKEAEPDFSLRVVGTDDTLFRGRENRILVRVRRLEGWDAPVEVRALNLPPGVTARPAVAEPKNTPYTGTCGEIHYLDGTNVEMVLEVAKDAPLNLAEIRFAGRGTYAGKSVERLSRSRYFRTRIRHIGDAEEDALRVTVADAPSVVLATPQSLSLGKDNQAELTAVVTRLDGGAGGPLELSIEAAAGGLSAEPVSVPVADTRAAVKLRASAKAAGEFVLVARVNGQVAGRSHPIQLRSPK
jgi:hypothetical protein